MATSLIQLTAIRVQEIALSDVVQTVFNHRAHSNLRELPTKTLLDRFETTGRTPSLQATSDVKHVPDFLTNMNHESRRREQGVHGIDETIQWIEIILRKSDTANPVLVGQSGAGKTTIVEEFARRLDKGAITHFKGYTIYRLNMSSFLATDGYMGQLDKKIKMLIQFFTENSNSILFIDEIHGLAGTGTHTSRPASPVINALKQHLTQTSSPRILMIGATTPSELLLLRDDALLRRLTEVPISTPDQTQLANTMKQELDSGTYSKNYGREISFVSGAGEFAVRLIESLPPDPSKDVSAMSRTSDLIDTACSLATHSSEGSVTINCEQIAKAFVRLYPKAEETSESLMSKFLPSAQPAL
jgi:ATP-dependent Clp protease ATP-binding subunit ClpA